MAVTSRSQITVSHFTLLLPWTRTSTGQRSFALCCSRTWNRLPTALRSPERSLASFKRQLKTHSSVPAALDSAGCSCGCRLPSSRRRCCDCTASSASTASLTRTQLQSMLVLWKRTGMQVGGRRPTDAVLADTRRPRRAVLRYQSGSCQRPSDPTSRLSCAAQCCSCQHNNYYCYYYTRLTAPFPGLPG